MKFIYIVVPVIFLQLTSCRLQKYSPSTPQNVESIDPRGNLMLLGKSSKERLQQEPFASWFNKNYADYKVDSGTAAVLGSKIKNTRFVIFMGTWCGDSRKEVPRVYKLLDHCGVPATNIQLIHLNIYDSVYKQSPGREEKGLNIHRVPDLLVYQNEKEIGRIIEKPLISWEKDLLTIVQKEKYEPGYKVVSYLQKLFRDLPEKRIETDIDRIADSLRSQISKNEGLQSFGNVLLATNETGKALLVLRLNTMLYPGSSNGFIALADAYLKSSDRMKAKENYKRALVIEPGHVKAMTMLAELRE